MTTTTLAERGIAIADRTMFELLRSECVRDDSDGLVLGLTDEDCNRVRTLAEASDAVQEALGWLQERGYARLETDGAGEHAVILRRPGDDN